MIQTNIKKIEKLHIIQMIQVFKKVSLHILFSEIIILRKIKVTISPVIHINLFIPSHLRQKTARHGKLSVFSIFQATHLSFTNRIK